MELYDDMFGAGVIMAYSNQIIYPNVLSNDLLLLWTSSGGSVHIGKLGDSKAKLQVSENDGLVMNGKLMLDETGMIENVNGNLAMMTKSNDCMFVFDKGGNGQIGLHPSSYNINRLASFKSSNERFDIGIDINQCNIVLTSYSYDASSNISPRGIKFVTGSNSELAAITIGHLNNDIILGGELHLASRGLSMNGSNVLDDALNLSNIKAADIYGPINVESGDIKIKNHYNDGKYEDVLRLLLDGSNALTIANSNDQLLKSFNKSLTLLHVESVISSNQPNHIWLINGEETSDISLDYGVYSITIYWANNRNAFDVSYVFDIVREVTFNNQTQEVITNGIGNNICIIICDQNTNFIKIRKSPEEIYEGVIFGTSVCHINKIGSVQ